VRARTGLLLVTAVMLAGCGTVDTASGPGQPTTTLTPAPVPEERGPDGGRLIAPGLSTRGVFDADALVESHRTTLTERGFVLTRNRTVVRPNDTAGRGTLNTVGMRVVVGPGAGSYHLTRVERSDREWPFVDTYALIGVWYSDPIVRNRFVDEGRVARYWGQNQAAAEGPVRDLTQVGSVRSDFEAVDLRVVGNRTVEGVRVYRLRGERFGDPDELVTPPLLSDPRNVSMTARIDERGVVRSYSLSFEATFGGDGPVRVRRTYRVADVGTTTVDRPAWVARANESVASEGQ
jgi:hypothetical protein